MNSPAEKTARYHEIITEVRTFLGAYGADMPKDSFEELVHDVARMRLRDEVEHRDHVRPTGEFAVWLKDSGSTT